MAAADPRRRGRRGSRHRERPRRLLRRHRLQRNGENKRKVRKLGQAPPSPSAYPRIHVGKSKYRKIAHSAAPPRVLDEGGGGGGLSSQVKSTSAAPVRAPHSPLSLFLLSVFPNLRSVGPRRGKEGGLDPPLRFSVRSLRSSSGSAPGRRSEERREKGGIRQLAPSFPH